jgi:hypothetical protein
VRACYPDESPEQLEYLERSYAKMRRCVPVAVDRPPLAFRIPYATDARVSILLEGETGWGKTQYALRCTPNPLRVCAVDCLLHLRPWHTGIVFECSFRGMRLETQRDLVDLEAAHTFRVRGGWAVIPAHLPRIFTYTHGNPPVKLSDPAVARRCKVVQLPGDIRAWQPLRCHPAHFTAPSDRMADDAAGYDADRAPDVAPESKADDAPERAAPPSRGAWALVVQLAIALWFVTFVAANGEEHPTGCAGVFLFLALCKLTVVVLGRRARRIHPHAD